jgi:hypothetical protein
MSQCPRDASLPRCAYVVPVTVSDVEAARVADTQQAAYFRAELEAQRRTLLTGIGKRRALTSRPGDAGRRQRASLASAEAEVRYLTRLIDRLDRRFAVDSDQSGAGR